MKLSDWPIWINDGYCDRWYECFLPTPGDEDDPNCYGTLTNSDGFPLGQTTFGELAQSIVEHAKTAHGVEIERDGSWYNSFTPDGKLYAGSSNVDEFGPVDTSGMEGEELEYWTEHNEMADQLRYQRIGTYVLSVAEEWQPPTEDECLGVYFRAGATEEEKENAREIARMMRDGA